MRILHYIFILVLLVSCAQVKTPTGGTKDIMGPEITESYPIHLETNYKAKSIAISFNELVTLTDPKNNIVITPPLKNEPEIYLKKGETLIIAFNDTLQENTTYSINLGDAISDYNESNPLENNLLVFSTGEIIDSLSVSGRVTLSSDDTPCEGCKVMLYRENDDSIVFKERPYYFVKTNEQGAYKLDYLKAGEYKILALLDDNNDFIFDPEEDQIGFENELLKVSNDTSTFKHDLSVFMEIPLEQSLPSFKLINDQKLRLNFALPVKKLEILKDSLPLSKEKYLTTFNENKDTVDVWIKESPEKNTEWKLSVIENDSLLENISIFFNGDKSKFECLSLTNNGISKISSTENIQLRWSKPVATFDESKFHLRKDSTALDFELKKEDDYTLNMTFFRSENENIVLKVDSLAVYDIFENGNDSLGHTFLVQEETYYGNLNVSIEPSETSMIVFLQSEKDEVVSRKKVDAEGKVSYIGLEPGKYNLFVLEDENDNQKWDTGNYLLKIKPEKIRRHVEVITVRSNWDLDLDVSRIAE